MKKRFLCLILTLIMMLSLLPVASAASIEAEHTAQGLYELGLFKGTGTNANGTPIFALNNITTRNQAIIMLVRLLGKEEEALAGEWDLPFTDVVKGSTSYYYIGYAYANGLTNGTTATTYSGGTPIRANQYITFVLRSLGYVSGEDFKVSTAWEFSDEIGLTHGEYDASNAGSFLRADVADISVNALEEELKGGEETLAEKLVKEDVFTQAQYEETVEGKPTPAPQAPKDETANLTFKTISKDRYYWGCWGSVPSFATVKSIEYAVDGDYVYFRMNYKGDTVQKFFTMPVIWEGGNGNGILGPMEIHSVKPGSSEFTCKVPKSTFETYTDFLICPSEDGKTGPGDYIIKVGYLELTEDNKPPAFYPYSEIIDDSYEVPDFKFHSVERARVMGGYLYRMNFTNTLDGRDIQFWTVKEGRNEGWNRGLMHRVALKDGDTTAIYFVPDYVSDDYDAVYARVRDDPKTGVFQEHAYIDIYFHGAPAQPDDADYYK